MLSRIFQKQQGCDKDMAMTTNPLLPS